MARVPRSTLERPGSCAARWRPVVLLGASTACAACGLVYELGLLQLGTVLVGGGVRTTSIVLGLFVFAMGLGSVLAKALTARPLAAFVGIEAALAVVGGTSGLVLYFAFAALPSFEPLLLVAAVAIGGLIGAEIPLLMELLQRLRRARASADTADLMAADYVGALLAGLGFPLLLVPAFGLVRSSLAAGLLNVACACLVVVAARPARRRTGLVLGAGLASAAAVLGVAMVRSEAWIVDARQRLFDDPVVAVTRSAHQEIVLTRGRAGGGDLRMYLDGDLQFSSVDEYRYHEALVHPAMSAGTARRVLVLGGGDGLAVREVLRHPGVREVVLVELDPAVTTLARTDGRLTDLNDRSLLDERVSVVNGDAFRWVLEHARAGAEPFDVVIADFPDPDALALARLYSLELYGGIAALLAPGGRLAVQAGSPYFAADAFWCVDRTVAAAGLTTTPYHVDVPSFGDWGFVLAAPGPAPVRPALDPSVTPQLRFLTDDVLVAAQVFPADRDRRRVDVNTVDDPVITTYTANGWNGY